MSLEDLEQRTLRSLEWDRLKRFLAAEATSDCGRESCLALMPQDDLPLINQWLDESAEAVSLIEANSHITLCALPDLRETLNRLEVGASLTSEELLDIRLTLETSKKVKGTLSLLPADAFPRLLAYLSRLKPADPVLQSINAALDDRGNVRDEASQELMRLRREVRSIDSSIKKELLKIVHSPTLSKALQEPIYTQREGRYVLPVNAGQRSAIHGIVHDSSASGLTIYVEPVAVIELSNQMRIKQSEVEHEITRIINAISSLASHYIEPIASSFSTLVALDVISARARLSVKYDGTRPDLTDDQSFCFREARHPLLVLQNHKGAIVANDIALDGPSGGNRTLVITGPNTGGKTVLLKTIGILSLMIKAGLLLPVKNGSKAFVFSRICADIGDEQSLEQSLSTFSSHMTNVVDIVNAAKPGILVLLDEAGAGTDPKEGAALARAVLEFLNNSGASQGCSFLGIRAGASFIKKNENAG